MRNTVSHLLLLLIIIIIILLTSPIPPCPSPSSYPPRFPYRNIMDDGEGMCGW